MHKHCRPFARSGNETALSDNFFHTLLYKMSARRHCEKSIAGISTDNGTADDNVGIYVRGTW